jgi:thioredoxin-related protein
MIFAEMERCQWCKKQKKEVFENEKVLNELKKRYIIARIKLESGDFPSFIRPTLFPTTYTFDIETLKEVDEVEGYMRGDKFLKYFINSYDAEMEPLEE